MNLPCLCLTVNFLHSLSSDQERRPNGLASQLHRRPIPALLLHAADVLINYGAVELRRRRSNVRRFTRVSGAHRDPTCFRAFYRHSQGKSLTFTFLWRNPTFRYISINLRFLFLALKEFNKKLRSLFNLRISAALNFELMVNYWFFTFLL